MADVRARLPSTSPPHCLSAASPQTTTPPCGARHHHGFLHVNSVLPLSPPSPSCAAHPSPPHRPANRCHCRHPLFCPTRAATTTLTYAVPPLHLRLCRHRTRASTMPTQQSPPTPLPHLRGQSHLRRTYAAIAPKPHLRDYRTYATINLRGNRTYATIAPTRLSHLRDYRTCAATTCMPHLHICHCTPTRLSHLRHHRTYAATTRMPKCNRAYTYASAHLRRRRHHHVRPRLHPPPPKPPYTYAAATIIAYATAHLRRRTPTRAAGCAFIAGTAIAGPLAVSILVQPPARTRDVPWKTAVQPLRPLASTAQTRTSASVP